MSELPGMWDESDLRGGEADCAEDLLIIRKLKEENAALKARVAEMVSALERINGMDSMSYHSLESAKIVVRHALSAYRKGGEV